MSPTKLFLSLWFILAILTASSCSFYKRVETQRSELYSDDEALILKSIYQSPDAEKYIVLRIDGEMWHLVDINISEDSKTITAQRSEVSPEYQKLALNIKNRNIKRYSRAQREYVNQVHFFVKNYDYDQESNLATISVDDITKLELYQHDQVSSSGATFVLVLVSVPVIGFAILAIICNCPYIYAEENGELAFQGNLFTGSIYPSLERSDYLELNVQPNSKEKYEITLANEKDETLFVNQLSLISIQHDPDKTVLLDKKGVPHTIQFLLPPAEAISFQQYDHFDNLQIKDGLAYDFGDPRINSTTKLNEIELTFENKERAKDGKLVLSLKNSNWGGFIYDEVSSLLGNRFNWYHERERQKDTDEILNNIQKSGMSVMVYIKVDDHWEFVDDILPTGSLEYRDVVIPIDLREIEADKIEIKLESGHQFWMLDYAAIDYSSNEALNVIEMEAESIFNYSNKNDIALISTDDNLYLKHLRKGESIKFQFTIPQEDEAMTSSYFVKGKGYYQINNDNKGAIKAGKLLKFRKNGGFSAYSFNRFSELASNIVLN